MKRGLNQHFVITLTCGRFYLRAEADSLAAARFAAKVLKRDCFEAMPDSRSSCARLTIVGPLPGDASQA